MAHKALFLLWDNLVSFPQSLRAHECSAGSSPRLQQGRDFSDIAQSYVYILGQLLVETVHAYFGSHDILSSRYI